MNEDRPILSGQKCIPKIGVSSNIRFMRVFRRIAEQGPSNDSGVVENGDFRSICRHISNTVHFKEKVITGC